MVELSEKWF